MGRRHTYRPFSPPNLRTRFHTLQRSLKSFEDWVRWIDSSCGQLCPLVLLPILEVGYGTRWLHPWLLYPLEHLLFDVHLDVHVDSNEISLGKERGTTGGLG